MRLLRAPGVYAPQDDTALLVEAMRAAAIPAGARVLMHPIMRFRPKKTSFACCGHGAWLRQSRSVTTSDGDPLCPILSGSLSGISGRSGDAGCIWHRRVVRDGRVVALTGGWSRMGARW